ncbi:MAG: hypothetical protein HUU50_11520 [Candidatus Brocadiae bacterium]|nr:hypothetical protein [Candidatus Brocadiia bacterium]
MIHKYLLITLLFAIFVLSLSCQTLDSFFGSSKDYAFLQGIEAKIDKARAEKNVQVLTAYTALLFYAQNLSGKRNSKYDADELLREATLIAGQKKNVQELKALEGVWRSKVFGPNDAECADSILKYIEDISKESIPAVTEKQKETLSFNAQKLLSAEEYARIDAVSQIAESVFGVVIESNTNVKDFVAQKDIVVSELKANLMLGTQFNEMKIQGREVHVLAILKKDFVLSTLRQSFLKRKQRMTREDWNRLEQNLPQEYTAIGMAAIED